MKKVCTNCKEEKDLSCFYNSKAGKLGKGSQCKLCITFKYDKGRNRSAPSRAGNENYKEWAKKYRQTQKNREYEREYRKTYLGSIKGNASKLFATAKKRAKDKGFDFNLTSEWVFEKLQPMKCEVTGLPLSIEKYENRIYRVNPYSPSIDRKDPTKGYTTDNCRIVCWIYNLAKADFSEEHVYIMAEALIKNKANIEL